VRRGPRRRADEHGHLDKRSFDAGAVAPLTVDQAVLAVDRGREEQRLQQPVLLDRRRQALELGLVELVARVEAVSDDDRRQRDGAQSGWWSCDLSLLWAPPVGPIGARTAR
jgi:hypothetical protein